MSLSTVAAREPAGLERPLAAAGTRDFVAEALARHAGDPRLLVLTVPAPPAPPELLLRASGRELGFLWHPPNGEACAGVGVVHRIDPGRGNGSGRFAELRRQADELWDRLTTLEAPGSGSVRPRLFGGLAFDAGAASRAPWDELGDGCFTLPRFLYARRGDAATLSLAARGGELVAGSARDRLVDELEALLVELEAGGLVPRTLPAVRAVEPSNGGWTAEIEAIRAAIAARRVEKVVAARRSRVEFEAPLDTVDVLLRLAQGLRASTRFAFLRERSTFLGATPERLIARAGLEIETEALAGSIALGQAERLLESGKDQREHRLVVEAIVRRLGPLCSRLEVAPEPRVRELREVLHLHTPIHGTLAVPRHVLELVEALHPTPAVGGVPTAAALRWIAEHEPDERGWYAAPVGWFDAAGDGEFAVALRSCVLLGREAYLYAGAGIVRDSDPELEYHEMELKKQALLRALGVC
jgi:isochorismate synthase